MNPQDPLANLHPLRQPEAIGWWPLAPGWWILLALTILVAGLAVYLLRRRYKRNLYRRRALRQLQSLHSRYQADGNAGDFLGEVNALLKSVALLAFPRAGLASQHGEAWRQFLNRSLPPAVQLPAQFDDAAYRAEVPDIDIPLVHSAAAHWIRKHRAAA